EVCHLELGMVDFAIKLLARYSQEFRYAPELWIIYGTLLVENKRWDELRPVAIQIRQEETLRDRLTGFGYYLEGRIQLAEGLKTPAAECFDKASKHPFETGMLAIATATALNASEQYAPARDILLSCKEDLSSNAQYWEQLLVAAYKLKQP